MEFDPRKNQHSDSTPNLALRDEIRGILKTRYALRSYGIDRTTINILIQAQFREAKEIYDATDQTLISIAGIGRKRLSRIRRSLLPYFIKAI